MKLILGTVQFGLDYGINNRSGKPKKEQVHEIFDIAYSKGISILDTAEAYGNIHEIIGEYHRSRNFKFEINTKFTASDVSIDDQVNAILTSLHIDKINTLYYHSFKDFTDHPGLLKEISVLSDKGIIKYIGLSVYSNEEFAQAIACKEINVIQVPFNLLDNFNQRGQLLKEAKAAGKTIHVRSVFLQGLFFMPLDSLPLKLKPLEPQLTAIQELAKRSDLSMEHLCLAYAEGVNEIDHIIIGIDNSQQLIRNIDSCEQALDTALIKEINAIDIEETALLYPQNWN
jgi:aryl-alcohol dehydrogenase-like predicted oxidoreductase